MSNNELQESLKRTLEALNELDAETLADMIYKWGPPPAGWALDVYMRNGKVLFTDYYSAGTLLAYEPDEIVITTIDNTQRDWDPAEVYTVGDTWELSDELMDKYRGYFEEDLPDYELQHRIWTELANPEEQDKEYARMLDWLWHGDDDTYAYLQESVDKATEEARRRLSELKEAVS